MAMFGTVIVLTVMFMPRGIGGLIDDFLMRRRFNAVRSGKTGAAAASRTEDA
jgi:hypothetical protein